MLDKCSVFRSDIETVLCILVYCKVETLRLFCLKTFLK